MNLKGNITEIMVMLIVAALTSALILSLVHFGVLSVRAENEEVSILNTEFIPFGREGYLTVKEFNFCSSIDENYNCLEPKEDFNFNEPVHFRFVVESSSYNGEIILAENYRLIDPNGNVLLDVDEKSNYNLDLKSSGDTELIYFKDYFVVNFGAPTGEYTLELLMENPLLTKNAALVKKVRIG